MPQSYSKLKKEALAMPLDKRADLAADLLESLDKLTPEEVDRLWAEEGERRLRAYRTGKMKALDGPETVAKIRARLKA